MTVDLRLLAGLLAVCGTAAAQNPPQAQPTEQELTELSLEELMQVPVEVGSRQSESLAQTAASVFVLNEPEIRRSGMRTVPDLLRLVPGLIVAQDVPGAFGFSSRLGEFGFAGMLVLLDGQRLYTTLLRREYWQAIDLPIEVIERIEVIRGPGGARWGDRASQGVINIVTKKAKDAAGLRVTGVAGTEERGTLSVRLGAAAGAATDFYLYAKTSERDGGIPNVAGDRWGNDRIGGRLDTAWSDRLTMTLDGEWHQSFLGDSYEIVPGFSSLNDIEGGHAKGRLRYAHENGDQSELLVGADTYDQDIRDFQNGVPDEHLIWREELYTATLQHRFALAERSALTVGAAIRQVTVENFYAVADFGSEFNETRGDFFAALELPLGETLQLTLGGNLGYQDGRNTTGIDVQPDVRLRWSPDPELTVWVGFSANEEPDRRIRDSGVLVRRKSSDLLATELGVRQRWGDVLLLQADTFVYAVGDQINGTSTDPGTGATLYQADGDTHAFGGELALTWNPRDNVRVAPFLATTQANSQRFDPAEITIEREAPALRGGLTVGWEPLPRVEVDTHVLYTEQHAGIPTWWRVDLRLAWRATDHTSVEVVGQNLTEPGHQEYFYLERVERGGYLLVTHRF